jgi:DNA (cytosine-5)-methyltransferase 1
MKSLELFSGAGGLAKGLEIEGFKHIVLVEFNRDACATLRNNFDAERVFEGDIRDYDFANTGHVDIVAGGPPCQPFSLGGKHQASNDQRDMFPYAIKAIKELKPKAFIFENVKGLLRSSFSDYFEYILKRLQYPDCENRSDRDWREHLEQLRLLSTCSQTPPDFHVHFKLINAADYGVPQTRERVIVVGIRADIKGEWAFPPGEHNLERLLWEQYVSGEYWQRHGLSRLLQYNQTPHFMGKIQKVKDKFGLLPPDGKPWVTMRDVLATLPDPKSQHGIDDHQFRAGARSYPGHTGSLFDLPSKTIKAGAHGVPGGENMIRYADNSIRYLTVHEAKLIQSFPASFQIHGAWGEAMRQIGNAVPVSVARAIGKSLMNLLSSQPQESTTNKIEQAA